MNKNIYYIIPIIICGMIIVLTLPVLFCPRLMDEFHLFRTIAYHPLLLFILVICSAFSMRYFIKCHWFHYIWLPLLASVGYGTVLDGICFDYDRGQSLTEEKIEITAIVYKKYEKRVNTRFGYYFAHHIKFKSFIGLEKVLDTDVDLDKDDMVYSTLNESDTVIVQYAVEDSKYYKIVNWHPTTDEIKELSTPRHYINNQLQPIKPYSSYSLELIDSLLQHSHLQVGTVFDKMEDEYYRHLVKVGVDSLHTTTHEFATTDRLYTKIYKRLNIGDKVILQVSDTLPEINRVINWQPTEAEIMQYQHSQPFDEKMIVKDYSHCTKEFEIENLHKSHKRIGIIYDKYEDDYVGAYLEVGIDGNHTRAHIFHTYDEGKMKVYNEASVGDTVIVRVSDAIPQLNRVLNWHPTHDEIDKYRTPIKLIEK